MNKIGLVLFGIYLLVMIIFGYRNDYFINKTG